MGKRKADNGTIVQCRVRNNCIPPHSFIGKVLDLDHYYLVDWWFALGVPLKFQQRSPNSRIVYYVRSNELEPLEDQSEEFIRRKAEEAEQNVIKRLPPIEASNPSSITKWLQDGYADVLPEYDPDDFFNRADPNLEECIQVLRDSVKAPVGYRGEPRNVGHMRWEPVQA